MEKVKTSAIPIYFFRFEDLLLQPQDVLKDMFRFILAEKNLDGKIIEQRIKEGTYGYCEETGEPIGIKRLIARPIAMLSIEAQEKHERNEKIFVDD